MLVRPDDPTASAQSGPAAGESGIAGPLQGMRVLLVEDNPTNQLVARCILSRAGVRIDIVCDGAEAVDAARAAPYDAILMDVRMPGMDGLEATRAIRAGERVGEHCRIIGITAADGPECERECLAAGMDIHLGKPFGREVLLQALAAPLPD